MTRKDYIAIAEAISKIDPATSAYKIPADYEVFVTLNLVIDALAEVMEADNPNFREAEFRIACGFDYEIVEVGF
jgi:hypothetical protein